MIGNGAEFYPFSSNWQDDSFTLLIPVTFATAAFLSVARRSAIVPAPADRADFAVFGACHLGAVILLSLISQFAFHDSWMSVQFYRTYFVPGSVFALIVIGGEAQRYGGRILGSAALYCGSMLIVLLWVALPVLPHLEIESGWSLWLALAFATIIAARVLYRTAAASVVLVAGSVLLSQCFYDLTTRPIIGFGTGRQNKKPLSGTYIGVHFFCINSSRDMFVRNKPSGFGTAEIGKHRGNY